MRVLLPLIIIVLTGCVSSQVSIDPVLSRTKYQQIYVSTYHGASSETGAPAETALGTRYQTGSISSAAADWSRWPAGTLFRVLATGEIYEVDDFTEDVVGRNEMLLYSPPLRNLPEAGRHYVTIEILKWGSPRKSAMALEQMRSSTAKKILSELVARYPQQ